ncbi:hypothetical protein [Amycolatopsis sp. NPDC004079]|uniref:hypothetical protein n=1 Tax=Amycolatopsis sp. NPDC004079 TaxID=3154549 RepID=UPI0033B68E70
MGAVDFYEYQVGTDVAEAFRAAVEHAQREHGTRGCTGTIADKGGDGFVIVSAVPVVLSEARFAARGILTAPGGNRWTKANIGHRGGPAGAIAVTRGRREHAVEIPVVPGGHADKAAAVSAAVTGQPTAGEHVVDGGDGVFETDGLRMLRGSATVRAAGADLHTGWLFFGSAPV